MKKLLLAAVILVGLGTCLYFILNQKTKAYSFQLNDLLGHSYTEADYLGKVTLVNFWYPSCPGCDIEMPKLIQVQQEFAHTNYQTFAISLNYNTLDEVKTYTTMRKLPFIVMYDRDNTVGNTYHVNVAPMSFLINQQGEIVKYYIGEPNWAELKQLIKKNLK